MERNLGSYARIYLPGFAGLAFSIMILFFPQEALDASRQGLNVWLTIVLPALLPFFIMAELMMGLGLVNFLGILLEPIMKPIFKIPGAGGFVVAMSLSSGFPIGAKITGRLRRDNLITKTEAERLICFAHTVDPLYMIGAVAIGMFGLPELAITFVVAHYTAIVIVGLLMRLHKGEETKEKPTQSGYLSRALKKLATSKSNKPFGDLFNHAVRDTFAAMLFIGGCIMMFSVLLRILTVSGVISFLSKILASILAFTGLQPEIISSLISGTFEISIGSQAASLASASFNQKAFAASWIMAWSGLSVHSQVAAMLHGTDISLKPFVLARFLHGIIAGLLTLLLLGPATHILKLYNVTVPVFTTGFTLLQPNLLARLWGSTKASLVILLSLILIAAAFKLYRRIVILWIK